MNEEIEQSVLDKRERLRRLRSGQGVGVEKLGISDDIGVVRTDASGFYVEGEEDGEEADQMEKEQKRAGAGSGESDAESRKRRVQSLFDTRSECDVPIEPFNMNDEREAGVFDTHMNFIGDSESRKKAKRRKAGYVEKGTNASGSSVRKQKTEDDESDESDGFANADSWDPSAVARISESSVERLDRADRQVRAMESRVSVMQQEKESYQTLLEHLAPGEAVNEAIIRLGKSGQKLDFDDVVEAADFLVSRSYSEVYSEVREAVRKRYEARFPAAAPVQHTYRMKWDTAADGPQTQVHGPCSELEMQQWASSGYFDMVTDDGVCAWVSRSDVYDLAKTKGITNPSAVWRRASAVFKPAQPK
eukprot:ANDGO_02692.mRNA.1 hypothetical protein